MGQPKNGKVLVTRSEMNVPEAYYLLDENTGDMELLVQSCKDWLEDVDFSRAEDFFFNTLDGESQVHGFCLPPQGAKKGEKYPAIVYVHGGPHPFYTYGFDLEHQCFAGAGFAGVGFAGAGFVGVVVSPVAAETASTESTPYGPICGPPTKTESDNTATSA
jgi:dipeptidyl aminopeptidase/acylaminoacyl peptidase